MKRRGKQAYLHHFVSTFSLFCYTNIVQFAIRYSICTSFYVLIESIQAAERFNLLETENRGKYHFIFCTFRIYFTIVQEENKICKCNRKNKQNDRTLNVNIKIKLWIICSLLVPYNKQMPRSWRNGFN